jgi:hypothetical protein
MFEWTEMKRTESEGSSWVGDEEEEGSTSSENQEQETAVIEEIVRTPKIRI